MSAAGSEDQGSGAAAAAGGRGSEEIDQTNKLKWLYIPFEIQFQYNYK